MEELVRRINQFFFILRPEERRLSIFGEPKGMCKAGKEMFEMLCLDLNNRQFLDHYDQRLPNGCRQCFESFIKHLWLVTD